MFGLVVYIKSKILATDQCFQWVWQIYTSLHVLLTGGKVRLIVRIYILTGRYTSTSKYPRRMKCHLSIALLKLVGKYHNIGKNKSMASHLTDQKKRKGQKLYWKAMHVSNKRVPKMCIRLIFHVFVLSNCHLLCIISRAPFVQCLFYFWFPITSIFGYLPQYNTGF